MNEKLSDILEKLDNVRGSEDQWTALCPAHNDTTNSLSIGMSNNGKVLLYCHAGCDFHDILAAIELKKENLYTNKRKSRKETRKIDKTYDYFDESGIFLYQVVRTDPKGFFQRRLDKRGWKNGLQGVRRVIYNLPNVIKAIKEDREILIVEGEKDADRLNSLGFTATTSPMGASNWKDEFSDFFEGANVIIIPDNDNAGKKYAQKVAGSLNGKSESIKIIELPNLNEKEDVSDWLDAGNTQEDLLTLICKTPKWKLNVQQKNKEFKKTFEKIPCTDFGNAERLVMIHGNNIRYCYEAKSWIIWNGIRWEWDKTGEIERKAKDTVRSIYGEAETAELEGERKELAKWAMESESKRAIKAMIELTKSEEDIPIRREKLDSNDWLLNCLNGTVDLRTGELREHKREDYITLLAPVNFNPKARLEILDKFLKRILPDNELREFIQIASGYSITGDTGEEKLFFAYGPPATGKSTLFAAIKSTLGDYAATTDFETFVERKGISGGPRNDIARLAGKRFVLGSEVDEGKKLAESLVKQITGNDTITARFLHQEYFEFQPKMKLWLAANFRPRVNSNDEAMWRRILQAPFTVQIPKEERDPKVKQILSDPSQGGPAILVWLVQGCLKWQEKGLKVPKIVEDFTNEYKEEMDPLKEFITDCCIVNPLAKVRNTALWEEYETWCKENGERYPLGRKKFKQRLEARGFEQKRTREARWWIGLGLKSDRDVTAVTHCDSNNNKKVKEFINKGEIAEQPSQVTHLSRASNKEFMDEMF